MYGKNEETFIIQKCIPTNLMCHIEKYISNEHIYIYIFKVYEINIDTKILVLVILFAYNTLLVSLQQIESFAIK